MSTTQQSDLTSNTSTPRQIVKSGCSWWVRDREPAFWDRVEQGTWEPLTYLVFDRFLDREHSCLDIGAWIGPTALYAACRARHCYAMEPDPVAFSRLLENVVLNPSLERHVSIFPQCLAATSGPVRIGNRTSATGGDSMSSMLFAESAVGWQAQGVTVECFLADNSIRDCSFIKMDIEGGEFDVLPAIAGYLAAQRPTLYLSLHPRFLPDAAAHLPVVRQALACYRHVFTPDFRPVSLDVLCDPATLHSCYELVLCDIDCS
jgi:FkbM family methyltransferase